jgi:hypothetical protein
VQGQLSRRLTQKKDLPTVGHLGVQMGLGGLLASSKPLYLKEI